MPENGRKAHSIRATDDEWKLIKAYADQVKSGKMPKPTSILNNQPVKPYKSALKKIERAKKLGQLAYSTVVFGNPVDIAYGVFFCVPEGNKYAIKAFFCPESEIPTDIWNPLDKAFVVYGYLIPASSGSGWIWETSKDEHVLGPDSELLLKKKTIKAAFACWLSDLLAFQKAVRVKDLKTR